MVSAAPKAGPVFVVGRISLYLAWLVSLVVAAASRSQVALVVCAALIGCVALADAVVVFSPLVERAGFQLARFWMSTFGPCLLTFVLVVTGSGATSGAGLVGLLVSGAAVVVAGVTAVRSHRLLRAW